MAVSYVGVSNGNSAAVTATSFDTTFPAGWAANDVVILTGHVRGTNLTMSLPADWLPLPGTWPLDQGANTRIYGWYRVLQAGDAAPTITNSGAMTGGWVMTAWRGVDTSSPIGQINLSSISSTSLTMPTLTGVLANGAIAAHVHAGVASGTIPTSITYNAAYTEVVDFATSRPTSSANIRIAAARRLITTAGNYGGEAVTSSNTASMIAMLVELNALNPSAVTLTPTAMTISAPTVTATPGAVSVTLTPAVVSMSARAINAAIPSAPWVRDSRESGTGAGTATSHTVAIPTCQVGDDLWASFTLNSGHGTVTDPVGWTRVYPTTIADDGTMTLLVYRKTATATEVAGGNVTVTVATAVRGNAGAVSIANANTGALDGSTSATGAGATATTGTSFTTTTANTLVLSILALDSGTEVATPPSSLAEQWNPTRSGITGQANAGAVAINLAAGTTSWNWSWSTSLGYKTWVGAIRAFVPTSNVTLTPAVTAIIAPAVAPASGPTSVTLTPAVSTITARPLTVSSALILSRPTVTVIATAVGPSAGAVNRTLTPAASTITAVAVSPVSGPTSATLTPATLTSSAIAVSPSPGAPSVALTPAVIVITARPLTATIVVQLSRPTMTVTAVSVTATPQPVNITLTPALITFTASALTVGSVGAVTLSPAELTVTTISVAATPGVVSTTLTPASFAISATALSVTPIVPLAPAKITTSAPAVGTGVGATEVTLTAATVSVTTVSLSVSLGAVQLTLTPAQINLIVPAVGATPGVVVRTLTPAVITFEAAGIDVDAGSVRVTLARAAMTISAPSVIATPGAIEINLVPAEITLSVVPGAISGILWTVNLVPAQLTLTANPSGVYQTLPGVDLMTIAFATVTGVGEYIRGELESTEGGVPQRFALVVPGSIAWDNCECGQFAQSITSVVSSRVYPTPAADVPTEPCGHPLAVVTVTMSLLRCVPTMNDNGNPPSVDTLLAAARVIEDDRLALRRGLADYLHQLQRNYKIMNYTIGAAQSVGPEGMCGGIEINYTFGINNDAMTCG